MSKSKKESLITKLVTPEESTTPNRINAVKLVDLESDAADAYLRLQTNISFAGVDKEIRCFATTSAEEAEGKTTSISNLAYVYAQKGLKVLLIDLDLRRPSVHKLLGLHNSIGVSDVCKGDAELKDAIQHFENGGFDVLTPGTHTPFPGKIFESKGLKDIFEKVKSEYDFVLVDTAPILVVNDALSLANLVDGYVLICAQHLSRKRSVLDAVNNLKSKGINIIGICMTMCDNFQDAGRGYGYGYSYGGYKSYGSYRKGYGYHPHEEEKQK
ncbi:MAG: CpsD/CapB family tyrosine-protein kinase [Bacilli bacterium]|nr:CpsD/CapB family tyrosine-protein kinase [Bacilli bacterium]